jgi:hypothetical protein
MPLGDILVITDDHKKAGREITDLVLKTYNGEKLSIAIGAESGASRRSATSSQAACSNQRNS